MPPSTPQKQETPLTQETMHINGMHIAIRPAAGQDLPGCMKLLEEWWGFSAAETHGAWAQGKSLGGKYSTWAAVTENNRVVGVADTRHTLPKHVLLEARTPDAGLPVTHTHQTVAILMNLCVATGFRGKGIAQHLVEGVKKETLRRGDTALWLEPDPNSTADDLHGFYHSLGFTHGAASFLAWTAS